MIKIITAIGNEYLNSELKKYKDLKIDISDIQYKEGIIEFLENNENYDFVILNDLLPGEISTIKLIKNILEINTKIKIILFLGEKDETLENQLYNIGVYKILLNNQIRIEELVRILKENNNIVNVELQEEINNLKRIILEKEKNKIKLNKNKQNNFSKIKNTTCLIKNKFKKIKAKNLKTNTIKNNKLNNKKGKTICIIGPAGVGKSIFSINFSKINFYSNKKILIIDLDIFNKSIQTILGIKSSDKISNIIKINKKLDLFIFEENKLKNNIDIFFNNYLDEIKNNYDYIIIDTNADIYNNKKIINKSDINLFLSDTNLSEISKSIKILELYINKLKIKKEKFYIIFNKYNKNSIDINLLKRIFSEFKIIGALSYSDNYNKLINKNNKMNLINKKVRREYLKINNEINKIIKLY